MKIILTITNKNKDTIEQEIELAELLPQINEDYKKDFPSILITITETHIIETLRKYATALEWLNNLSPLEDWIGDWIYNYFEEKYPEMDWDVVLYF